MTDTTAGTARHLPPIPTGSSPGPDERWAERLFERDASLWSTDPEVRAAIAERLGWLGAPDHFHGEIGPLEAFGEAIRDAGFTTAVVGGMGGSSLAPEVLQKTFGDGGDWLQLRILDSTDPAAVAATVDDLYPLETLFIVATKSGTTAEPLAFLADAWEPDRGGDPGATPPPAQAGRLHGPDHRPGPEPRGDPPPRRVPRDLPEPARRRRPLLGADLRRAPAGEPHRARPRPVPRQRPGDARPVPREGPARQPGLALGLALGAGAVAGRDKLTFVADPEIAAFGSWAEQLIAESTGKHGVGIVPVDLEPLGAVGPTARTGSSSACRWPTRTGRPAAPAGPRPMRC